MPDKPIGDSVQDFGTSTQITGTVGTSATLVPSVAGNPIALLLVRCPSDQSNSRRLLWSLDNATYHTLAPGEYVGWPIKGNLTQIYLKGNGAAVDYEITINMEPT